MKMKFDKIVRGIEEYHQSSSPSHLIYITSNSIYKQGGTCVICVGVMNRIQCVSISHRWRSAIVSSNICLMSLNLKYLDSDIEVPPKYVKEYVSSKEDYFVGDRCRCVQSDQTGAYSLVFNRGKLILFRVSDMKRLAFMDFSDKNSHKIGDMLSSRMILDNLFLSPKTEIFSFQFVDGHALICCSNQHNQVYCLVYKMITRSFVNIICIVNNVRGGISDRKCITKAKASFSGPVKAFVVEVSSNSRRDSLSGGRVNVEEVSERSIISVDEIEDSDRIHKKTIRSMMYFVVPFTVDEHKTHFLAVCIKDSPSSPLIRLLKFQIGKGNTSEIVDIEVLPRFSNQTKFPSVARILAFEKNGSVNLVRVCQSSSGSIELVFHRRIINSLKSRLI